MAAQQLDHLASDASSAKRRNFDELNQPPTCYRDPELHGKARTVSRPEPPSAAPDFDCLRRIIPTPASVSAALCWLLTIRGI